MIKNKITPMLLIVVSLIGLYFYIIPHKDNILSQTKIDNQQEEKLTSVVKQIVSSYLKSPATAQFTNMFVMERTKDNSSNREFKAFGDVDSQNSFGALLRNHFNLTLNYKGENIEDINNWTVKQFDLGDENIISDGQVENPPFKLTQSMIDTMSQEENILRDLKELKQLTKLKINGSLTKEQENRIEELTQKYK